MPRKAKNVEDQKGHISKAELAQRQESQLEIGTDQILIPDFVLQEPEAKNLWDILQPQFIEKKFLNNFTFPTFGVLCRAWAMFCNASLDVSKRGLTIEIETKNGFTEIQNPNVLVMTKAAEILKKYGADFYMSPAAIASYARNNKPKEPEDKFGAEFDN
jgi:phage terminase small subunit